VIGWEDYVWNDLYCVQCVAKLYYAISYYITNVIYIGATLEQYLMCDNPNSSVIIAHFFVGTDVFAFSRLRVTVYGDFQGNPVSSMVSVWFWLTAQLWQGQPHTVLES